MAEYKDVNWTERKAVEVGNIFKFGTISAENMKVSFIDQDGQQKPFWFGSYGIGLGRAMAVAVEHHHDEQGIIWPTEIAPFQIHLLDLTKADDERQKAVALYQDLLSVGLEVLYDDRPLAPGSKFADADLLGIPVRLVISSKSLADDSVELKERSAKGLTMLKRDRVVAELVNSQSVDKRENDR